jgi:sugar-phosphatase
MLDRSFAAFLFDMDGTLLDSIAVANRIWTRWAISHALDPDEVLAAMHGVQVAQTMRRFAPVGTDIDREALALTQAEVDDVEGIVEILGARRFLDSLPSRRWAIVTSAPRRLAIARLDAVGLPLPEVLITAEDVEIGKPAPDCYIAAAQALGVEISDCLVWEDAPAGIQAAEAAGATVVIVAATHSKPIQSDHFLIQSYEGLCAGTETDGRLSLAGLAFAVRC